MKRPVIITALLISVSSALFAQTTGDWRLGLQTGAYANRSEFSGGMSNAPAEFSHDPFGSGSFDLSLRYDHNRRWAFMSGVGFTAAGFNFTLANDYSLSDDCHNRYDMLESSIPVVNVPVMALLKTNNNCRNWRWIFGAGVVNSFAANTRYDNTATFGQESEQNAEYMTVNTRSVSGYHFQTRFLVGREKEFNKGGLLTFMLVCNTGYSEMASATVTYNQDNRLYNHEFTNKGSYCGFSIAYSFRPVGKKMVKGSAAPDEFPLKKM